MSTEDLVNGINLYTVRAVEKCFETLLASDLDGGHRRLEQEIRSIDALARGILSLQKKPAEEGEAFQDYIKRTASVGLPTDEQIGDLATTLDKRDRDHKPHRGNYFHGYHFFIDPGAGQEDIAYKSAPCTAVSTEDRIITREEYLSKFGYISFDPITMSSEVTVTGSDVTHPFAFTLDKRVGEEDYERTENQVLVPVGVLRLARLVSYEGSPERAGAWVEQMKEMKEVVSAGRERYAG